MPLKQTPGCTKAYFSTSKLKDHLAKGTCVLESTLNMVHSSETVNVYLHPHESSNVYTST
jgi:hypothetical protein